MRRHLGWSILSILMPLVLVCLFSFQAEAAVELGPELAGCRNDIAATYNKLKSFRAEFDFNSVLKNLFTSPPEEPRGRIPSGTDCNG